MHSLFRLFFTAIFVPKNKIHRKYVHLFRPKNKRPKNKKTRFSAPKTKKKTNFGRSLHGTTFSCSSFLLIMVLLCACMWCGYYLHFGFVKEELFHFSRDTVLASHYEWWSLKSVHKVTFCKVILLHQFIWFVFWTFLEQLTHALLSDCEILMLMLM